MSDKDWTEIELSEITEQDDAATVEETPLVESVPSVVEEEIEHQMDLSELLALTAKPPKKEEEKPIVPIIPLKPEKPDDPENSTITYYNENADSYYQKTIDADMSSQYRFFRKYLPNGARILDLGCGSGRDTKYFRDNGYNVTAVDGSEEMCRKAEVYTGITVRRMDFLDLSDREIYAGIWASASLLHIARKDLIRMLAKLRKALTKDGVIYVSFKEGNFEGVRDGRYYTDLTEGELFNLVNTVGGMKIVEAKHFTEHRETGDVQWLCAIIKKW